MSGYIETTREVGERIDREVARYLQTGDYDSFHAAWPSYSLLDRATEMCRRLTDALVAEVRLRARGRQQFRLPEGFETVVLARQKLSPMVNGLFPAKERQTILDVLKESVVFLHHDNFEEVLRNERWQNTAWELANLYLGSIGAPCLDGKPCRLVGMSCGTTCYIAMTYFDVDDPFADFVIHEAAHVFHNWKRKRVGLPHTRHREWLLPIDFCKRETFAYACEAYGRILEQAKNPAGRRLLHAEYAEKWVPAVEDRVDRSELADIVGEAVESRNGWKRILARCAPPGRVFRGHRTGEPKKD